MKPREALGFLLALAATCAAYGVAVTCLVYAGEVFSAVAAALAPKP